MKKFKIIKTILALLVMFPGVLLIADPEVVFGILLLIWGDNISQIKEEELNN